MTSFVAQIRTSALPVTVAMGGRAGDTIIDICAFVGGNISGKGVMHSLYLCLD